MAFPVSIRAFSDPRPGDINPHPGMHGSQPLGIVDLVPEGSLFLCKLDVKKMMFAH